MSKITSFNPNCTACPRLATFLREVRAEYPDYHARPVAPFGDAEPELLIVGLAPGLHGANATGRPFTGDFAGVLLYATLHEFGYASRPQSVARDDGLELRDCRITNAVKCVPPQNKPETSEIKTCNRFLRAELAGQAQGGVVLALGNIAHAAVLQASDLRPKDFKFGHAAIHQLPRFTLVDSYHCSRYNTQTKRLTTPMFKDVFNIIATLRKRALERA
ncbi:MAG: uracil-DNA glycosylase [Pseudomonadota bacterium]